MSANSASYSCKLFALFLLSQQFCSSSVLSKMLDIDETTSEFDNSVYGENDLWGSLYEQCGRRTSYSCVQDGLYSYLDRTLDADYVTDTVAFRHNGNNYTEMCRRVKKDDPGDYNERESRTLELPGEEDEGFSEFIEQVEGVEKIEGRKTRKGKELEGFSHENTDSKNETLVESELNKNDSKVERAKNIRDISDILYDRGVKYLMTHDMELALPSFVFGGGKVKLSPRGFDEDGGALVKFNVVPDQPQEGRFFFKHIKKLFKKKLMTSMMAAILIIKLLKLKLMFFLPVLVGVGTAKKILLKVLLFLFPALAHLFKLCAYYHHKHAKYHHHHHQIAHHHHHIPVPVYTPVSSPGELPAPYPASYDSSGPGVYTHSRTESPGSLADLASWGLGEYPSSWDNLRDTNLIAATDPPRYSYPTRAQQTAPPLQYPSQADLKRLYASSAKSPQSQYNQALTARLQALTPRPVSAAAAGAYDPFYSPMLTRLDAVFNGLGVQEEGCRERLVCSMYKNPARYSPHSNLVSAELSRDPSELQKPLTANNAVVRFYRYIQAARDGQEHKECLRLYAVCALATE